jgi:hydrogenase nickel incorporation protein HypB
VRDGRLRNWAYSCHSPDLDGILNVGAGLTDAHVPGTREERIIRLEHDILSKNGAFARANRDRLKRAGIFALNLVSSPGSGKTSLVVRAIADLKNRFPTGVIDGDQKTSNDAGRIAQQILR